MNDSKKDDSAQGHALQQHQEEGEMSSGYVEWLTDLCLVPIDRNRTRAVSPFRRPVLVVSGSTEELICFYDELSKDQIPAHFDEMLSDASPSLVAEFLAQRTQLPWLSEFFEKSLPACEHILQSDDPHPYGGRLFSVVKDMALVAKSQHCANAVLEEIERRLGGR